MDELLASMADALRRADWAALKPLLHPYLHLRRVDGVVVRGRTHVLALLRDGEPPPPLDPVELRDGQVYRWG